MKTHSVLHVYSKSNNKKAIFKPSIFLNITFLFRDNKLLSVTSRMTPKLKRATYNREKDITER